MRKLAIIGTKEFAQQIRGFAKRSGEYEFVGYLDDLEQEGSIIEGFPVLGNVKDGIRLHKEGIIDCVFIAIGYTRFDLRESYYNDLKGQVPFATIIEPTAEIGEGVKIGEGVYVGRNTIIDDGSELKDNVFIHRNCLIGHESVIGKHTYCSGLDHMAGFCNVGERTFIGLSVCVADHMTIGDDVWVGIGSIVAKNLKKPGKYLSQSMVLTKIE